MAEKLTGKGGEADLRKWLLRQMEYLNAELDIWRARYPHSASFVDEEARARVEKRKPIYGPPKIIGAGRAALKEGET